MANIVQFVDTINQVFPTITATFTTTASNAWPACDTGQTWILSSTASHYSGTGTVARIALSATNDLHMAHVDTTFTDGQVSADVTIPVLPTGAAITTRVHARGTDFNNYYEAQLSIATTGVATISINRRVGGTLSQMATATAPGTHAAGNIWRIVLRCTGSTLRAKAWRPASDADPGWTVSAVNLALTTGTRAGCACRLETGNTNTTPVNIDFDSFSVTSPAQIRLDLNAMSGGLMVAADGIDVSPPPLRRSTASSMLTNGDYISATAWGNRTIKLTIQLAGQSTVDSAATALQALARELVRDRNILRMRLGTVDYFFRTYAAPDYAFKMTRLLAQNGSAVLEIPAEPFAWGLRETVAATVNDDPAAGSNPQYFDVAVTKGDTDVPFILHLPGSTLGSRRSYISVRNRDLSGLFYLLQAETADVIGTDAAVQTNDATMSGSGNNYVRISYATSTSQFTERLGFSLVAPGNHTSYRGQYRVLMRYRKNNSLTHNAQILWGGNSGSTAIQGEVVVLGAASSQTAWVDMGVFTLPPGPDPVYDGYSGEQIEVAAPYMSLRSGRVSGVGTLDIDAFVFMPADQMAQVLWATQLGSTPPVYTLDGVWQGAYGQAAGPSTMAPHMGFGIAGVFPTLRPNATNRVYFVADVGSGGRTAFDTLTDALAITLDYWPQYLTIRPATT